MYVISAAPLPRFALLTRPPSRNLRENSVNVPRASTLWDAKTDTRSLSFAICMVQYA
jgi:hypothetical protein